MPMVGVSQALLPEAFSQGSNFFSRPFGVGVKEREKSLPSRLPRKESGGSKASEKDVRSRAFDSGGQAPKGAWGMSRHQEALKGAEDCDKPGVTVKQVMIPGFPNWHALNP